MTKEQFLEVLLAEGVRFGRVNGFSLSYERTVVLRGRIPLTLARKIRGLEDNGECGISFGGSYVEEPDEWATNVDLADMLSEAIADRSDFAKKAAEYESKKTEYIKQAEQAGKLDDIYVLSVYVDTPQGLRHIIRTIQESGYINQCVWHR